MEKIIYFWRPYCREKRMICAWIFVLLIICDILISPETGMWADSLCKQWNLLFVGAEEMSDEGECSVSAKRRLPGRMDFPGTAENHFETDRMLKETAAEISEIPAAPISAEDGMPKKNESGEVISFASEEIAGLEIPVIPGESVIAPGKPEIPAEPGITVESGGEDTAVIPIIPEESGVTVKPEESTAVIPVISEAPTGLDVPVEPGKDVVAVVPIEPNIPVESDGTEEPSAAVTPDLPASDGTITDETPESACGFLIDGEGMIYGVTDELDILDGVIVLPETGCAGIRSDAFLGTEGAVVELYIPASVVNIEAGALGGLTSLEWIEVDTENPVYESVNGVLFTKDLAGCAAFPSGRIGIYEMPAGVQWISPGAFSNTLLSGLDLRKCSGITVGEDAFAPTAITAVEIWYAEND